MLAVKPDHERPGGEGLSQFLCVGSDRGSVCVGCEETVKWESEHRHDQTGTTERADGTWMKVSVLCKTLVTRYLSQRVCAF